MGLACAKDGADLTRASLKREPWEERGENGAQGVAKVYFLGQQDDGGNRLWRSSIDMDGRIDAAKRCCGGCKSAWGSGPQWSGLVLGSILSSRIPTAWRQPGAASAGATDTRG